MKRIHPEYTYTIVPIVLGITGLVTNSLVKNLGILGFEEKNIPSLIFELQTKALVGSTRIMKAAMTFKS